jgi:hypothetical protein
MTKPKEESVVEDIVRAIQDSLNVKGELESIIKKISLAKQRKDTKNANKLYKVAIRICEDRNWYSSAAEAARAIGKPDMENYYRELHAKYINDLFRSESKYKPDHRGKWGWLDGEDSW